MPDPVDPAPVDPAPTDPPDKTFTQDEVDRIIKDRLARAKSEPPSDYADLQAKAAKLDELEAANQSELEKANARAELAEQNAKTAQDRANAALRRAAVVSAATVAGAVDADAVFALLANDAVTVGDDGQVTGAEEAVKELLESKPYLVGQPSGNEKPKSGADGGPRGSAGDDSQQLSRDDLTTMSPDQIEEARQAGRLTKLMSGG